MSMPKTTVASLFAKCITAGGPDSCWVWTGRAPDRYGTISMHNFPTPTHRAAYMFCVGEIPDGLFVCHKCDNPLCCNPRHLWLGTAQDNNKDCASKLRHSHGERHPDAIISDDDVREVLSLKNSGVPRKEIAKRFNMSLPNLHAIWSGRTWKPLSREAV